MTCRVRRLSIIARAFAPAKGTSTERGTGYGDICELWRTLACELRIAEKVVKENGRSFYSDEPPDDLQGADELLAVRKGTVCCHADLVLRRVNDFVCLGLMVEPGESGESNLDKAVRAWQSASGIADRKFVGTVCIITAELASKRRRLDLRALGPAVGELMSASGNWGREGAVHLAGPYGPFAVWEAPTEADGKLRDPPIARRIVVVAPRGRKEHLDAWAWTVGADEMTPFANYLLEAAVVRHYRRLWSAGNAGRLYAQAGQMARPLLELTADVAERGGREPDADKLLSATAPLVSLQVGESGLVDQITTLRDMQRSVAIAAANMAEYASHEQTSGLFADDAKLAAWLASQLEHDAAYLASAAERVRTLGALADQLIQRGLVGRQERVNLGLTGVIGAVLMVLAAIQSFNYAVPLAQPVQAPMIATLGALALVLSTVVVRTAARRRIWSGVALCAAASLLVATVAWTAVVVVATLGGIHIGPGTVLLWSVGAALATSATGAAALKKRRSVARAASRPVTVPAQSSARWPRHRR